MVVFLYTAPIFAALGLQTGCRRSGWAACNGPASALAFRGIALAFLGGDRRQAAPRQGCRATLLALLAGAAWGATTVAIRCSSLASAPATETLLYQLLGAFRAAPCPPPG